MEKRKNTYNIKKLTKLDIQISDDIYFFKVIQKPDYRLVNISK